MTPEKRLSRELLKQNGIEPGKLAPQEQETLRRMIDRENKRVTRMKWITAAGWILLVLVHFLAGALRSPGLGQTLTSVSSGRQVPPTPYLSLLAFILWWIAVVCSASLAIRLFRLRGLRQQQILQTLARIEDRLAQLDEPK